MIKKELQRDIPEPVQRELWARAAGRCGFEGCNKLLYRSSVTQERVNIAEKAHIYSFSEDGPRGHGALTDEQINDIGNLILVCHECHKKIDADEDGERYSAKLVKKFKTDHEKRIEIVTGVHPSKKSHVVLFGANIGDQKSVLHAHAANDALFPEWYPAEERSIQLSMSWEGRDDEESYWTTESKNLKTGFKRKLGDLLESGECSHLSLFGFAPMPLLTLFGALLTDKVSAQTYQLHREPYQSWKWQEGPDDFQYLVTRPTSFKHPPVLIISLSDSIAPSRITSVLGDDVSIWGLTIEKPYNDFLKSKHQLSRFRETAAQLVVEIGARHGKATPLSIFPAMPVACAIELGRVRMPKADSDWIIYDQNHKHGKFIRALEIGKV